MRELNDITLDLLKKAYNRIVGSINLHVFLGSLAGIFVVSFSFYILWRYFGWIPTLVLDKALAQSLLIGVIQIQAGILAIAVSFSILYLQVSVEAYSIRASRLLIKHHAFRQMVRDYVFLLSINCLLALLVTDTPFYLPLVIGFMGAFLLLGGIHVLLRYISAIALFITPEGIVNEISRDLTRNALYREAIQKLNPKNEYLIYGIYDLQRARISMPTLDQLGDGLQLLVDIARKMVHQGDYMVVKTVVARISGFDEDYLPLPKDIYFDDDFDLSVDFFNAATSERPSKEELLRLQETLQESAYLCYIIGGLAQIWDVAIRSNDKISAQTIISAIGRLLNGRMLEDAVHRTDLLSSAIFDLLIKDTSKPPWLDLRSQVVGVISDGLRLPTKTDIKFRNHRVSSEQYENPNARTVYTFLENVLQTFAGETPRHRASLLTGFAGMEKILIYGASSGSAMIGDFSYFLGGHLGELLDIGHRWVADVLEQVGKSWVRASADGVEVYSNGYYHLLDYGLKPFLNARFAALKGIQSTETMSGFVNPFYDALEKISIECVNNRQYKFLEHTLSAMYDYHILFYLMPDPWYPVACVTKPLSKAVETHDKKAIEIWLTVSKSHISILSPKSSKSLERLSSDIIAVKGSLNHLASQDENLRKLLNDFLHLLGNKLEAVSEQEQTDWFTTTQIKDWKPGENIGW